MDDVAYNDVINKIDTILNAQNFLSLVTFMFICEKNLAKICFKRK